jgi:hypothetical protein
LRDPHDLGGFFRTMAVGGEQGSKVRESQAVVCRSIAIFRVRRFDSFGVVHHQAAPQDYETSPS